MVGERECGLLEVRDGVDHGDDDPGEAVHRPGRHRAQGDRPHRQQLNTVFRISCQCSDWACGASQSQDIAPEDLSWAV